MYESEVVRQLIISLLNEPQLWSVYRDKIWFKTFGFFWCIGYKKYILNYGKCSLFENDTGGISIYVYSSDKPRLEYSVCGEESEELKKLMRKTAKKLLKEQKKQEKISKNNHKEYCKEYQKKIEIYKAAI